jgi:hypothetical protein
MNLAHTYHSSSSSSSAHFHVRLVEDLINFERGKVASNDEIRNAKISSAHEGESRR